LRAAVVFFFSAFAFLLGLVFIRKLRTTISEEADVSTGPAPSLDALPMHVYNTVIQELKQQKNELQVQSRAEQNRAHISDTLNQAVLLNLPCGVIVFGTNGLVKTTNPAAKEILGFGSTAGMSADDIFRGAVVRSVQSTLPGASPDQDPEESVIVADEVGAVLHGGSNRSPVEAEYETPAGEERYIAVRVSPVPAQLSSEDGSLLGVACFIEDRSELERMRHQQELQGEASAEMAVQLRTSLATITGYAQQLANSRDPEMAKQLAADIANVTAQLDHTIGSFLADKQSQKSMAAAASVE
jgi:PAS domain-containing protein